MGLGAVCQSVGTLATGLASAFWLAAGAIYARGDRRIRDLAAAPSRPDRSLPTLAILATARNEAGRVEPAARSLLEQDYPGARVCLVDDRSTDETGSILDRLASEVPRLEVLHVETLPPGWIGKPHALAQAASRCKEEWLLFTDGDILLDRSVARRAVMTAIRERADHVAIGPDLIVESVGEAVFVAYFVIMFHLSTRPWSVERPRSEAFIGIGAFNLVRRQAYEMAGGHARIRYELVDDLALGKILKRSGARQLYLRHGGSVRAKWQEGARGLVRGVEKNAFAAFGYRTSVTILAVAAQLTISLMPVVGFLLPGSGAKLFALASWPGIILCYAVASRNARVRVWQALLMPLGGLLFTYAIARSAALALFRGGVDWRGTFYPLDELRRNRVL
jgi:glycosyltransferase involved in cell wall biosynthesis